MALKFYLNKFLKVDNIEKYTLAQLFTLKDSYTEFIEESEGYDPDFPMTTFGEKGKKIGGTNIHTLEEGGNIFAGQKESSPDQIPNVKDTRNLSVNEKALEFLKNIGMKTNS